MYKNLLNLLVLAVLLLPAMALPSHFRCMRRKQRGQLHCKMGNGPLIKGNVKVYASTNPNHIPEDVPVAVANISDLKMTVITTDPTQRYYYTLVFADKYRVRLPPATSTSPAYRTSETWEAIPPIPPKRKCIGACCTALPK